MPRSWQRTGAWLQCSCACYRQPAVGCLRIRHLAQSISPDTATRTPETQDALPQTQLQANHLRQFKLKLIAQWRVSRGTKCSNKESNISKLTTVGSETFRCVCSLRSSTNSRRSDSGSTPSTVCSSNINMGSLVEQEETA